MECPSCGAQAPVDARFCPACGHGLAVGGDQRRVATVLFADLVGFTGLSESRDPEQVKNLVDRCFERLAADVTAYGGKIDKIVGDAMVALFGAPVAHEDDAERAVRAALQMQRSLEVHAAESGVAVRIRVGINTGEVLVGGIRAGDDYTAMGDVVNVASRLQEAAQPGQVVVGPSTYQATSDVVRYEPLGEIEVKGRGGVVEAWTALGAITRPGYRPRRVRTPFVGREPELGMLTSAVAAAAARNRPHLVLVTGEAGIGKSRLGEELAARAGLEHDALMYVGRCVPYGEANPWWPVADVLRQAFGIDVTDASGESVEKIRRGVARATERDASEVQRIVDGLLYLMGLENPLADVDPARAVDEAIAALAAVIEGIASRRLLVLFLADLHWADAMVLDLVDNLAERLRNLPVVLVGTSRPELQDRWAPEPARNNVLLLNLDPLDSESTRTLIDALAGDAVSDSLRRELEARSGGNPFFVEELVALLSESGVLGEGGTADGADLPAPDLPSSLRGLVAARLDGLSAPERAMLEDAAVVGRAGSVAALVALGEARGDADVVGELDGLVVRDLVVVSEGQFEFKSDLVREVAYETLTKSSRARRHAALANWLSLRSRETGREDEYVEQIAHHFAEAAGLALEVGSVEGVPDDVRSLAIDWVGRAAARAQLRESALVAEQFFDQGLGLLTDEEADLRFQFLLGRAAARSARHDLPGARVDVEEVLATSGGDGAVGTGTAEDARRRVRALTILGDVEQKQGETESALATLDQAMALAHEAGDRQGLAEALRQWGFVQLFRGRFDEAERAIAEARDAFHDLGERRSEAWALQNLAWIAFSRGETAAADARLSESATMFEELSDWGGRGWALGLLGFVRLTQGRLEEAGALAEQVIVDARRAGDRWGLGMTLVLRSSVELWLGHAAEAVELAREASEVFEVIDDVYGRSLAVANLTRAYANVGRIDQARTTLEEAVTLFALQGEGMGPMGANLRANVLCQLGDARGALAASTDVEVGGRDVPTELSVCRALALVQAGLPEDALPHLDSVVDEVGRRAGPGDEGARTFAYAVRAIAEAALGSVERALGAGARVHEGDRGTYVDETYADLGVALAHVQQGDREAALGALELAAARVDATDDRLTQAIVRLALGRALEALGDDAAEKALREARERFDVLGVDPYGWETAFQAAASGEVSQPVGER